MKAGDIAAEWARQLVALLEMLQGRAVTPNEERVICDFLEALIASTFPVGDA